MSISLGLLVTFLSGCAFEAMDAEPASSEPVQATQQALSGPDLIVESFTLASVTGGVLATVVIKNQGDTSAGSMTYAFRNIRYYPSGGLGPGCYGGTWAPNTGPLAAGASRTFTTTLSGWTISGLEACGSDWYTEVDAITNSVAETDETNNIKWGKD
ncbi:MAG TPA: hypothetical protein VL242_37440 [Sorangium sp.]|nr:hypothetical protein [Sorangium sp.]